MIAQTSPRLIRPYGLGVPQDCTGAAKWYRKAADQGFALAQYNLGVMFDKGRGVFQDYAEALKWCRKAAHQNLSEAQYNLGISYGDVLQVPS
jgi:uncharacterized protein